MTKSYPSYKDSGVEWIGNVPEYWKVLSLKHCFKIIGGSTPKSEQESYWDGEFAWVTPSDLSKLSSMGIRDSQRKITAEGLASCGTTLVPRGSIVLSTRAPIGSFAIAETELCTNQGCKSLVPFADTQSRFYGYLLSISTGELNIRGKGTTFLELSSGELGAFKVGVPTVPEQIAIASFLDRETTRIDALITAQHRLIELLKEKRQAVISHAVTKGLDPTVPMKDSGVEWLGEVPEGWEIKPVRRVLSAPLSNGIFKKKEEFGEGALLINVFDIYRPDFKVDFDSLDRVKCNPGEIVNYEVLADDLLFVRSSLKQEGIAVVAIAGNCSEPVVYECHLIRARPNRQVLNGHFGSYVLNSVVYRSKMVAKAKITTMTTIDQEAILSTKLPLPPISEQSAIAAFLDRETARIDILTTEAERGIVLLKERRSALISAAVTGKIDVR